MSLLLIEYHGAEREIALLEDGHLLEYVKDNHQAGLSAEDIYLGQVGRVMKSLSAVFVRLSKDVEGFLPFHEIPGGKVPRPGDQLLVQVKRPPQGSKAAYLTCDIALPGASVLLMPMSQALRVSKRIHDEGERQRLLLLAKALAPAGCGLVMRQESTGKEAEDIRPELELLLSRWRDIQAESARHTAPCPIAQAPDALSKLLRELHEKPERVLSNQADLLPDQGIVVSYTESPMQLYDVHHKLAKALRRKINLKSGATLVIDPCEAMTVIDVNTAKSVLGRDRDKALKDTNAEAAQEIARLLRLRRVGGIVLIDFIDMDAAESRMQVLETLKSALARDPVKTAVHGFTSLGLIELTRKKADAPLAAANLRICPACRGTGYMPDEALDEESTQELPIDDA